MGLIKNAFNSAKSAVTGAASGLASNVVSSGAGAVSSVVSDQYREYFYCDSLSTDVLVTKAKRKNNKNNKGADNIISNGSIISVADGQCMIIVDNGKVAEYCAEPGEFVYDSSSEPSLLDGGNLADNIKEVFKNIGKRFVFGGEAPKEQRVYYVNTKEILGNKYGTPQMVPFRVVDKNIGLDMDVNIKCFGEYSYRITNPILFYANVTGNITEDYKRSQIESQMKSELLTNLQPAFTKIGDQGIRYSSLPGHTAELADALNEVLSNKWRDKRGIEIVEFGVSSVKADEEDEKTIKQLQKTAVFRDPTMQQAQMVNATSQAMVDAANNSGGAAIGFMGMNMAQGAGQGMYQMAGQQAQYNQQMGINNQPQNMYNTQGQPQAAAPAADAWTCPKCGKSATGKFCMECGTAKPVVVSVDGWTCPQCSQVNKGKFCSNCGAQKPAGTPTYKCDKCGWEPADPTNPPKFCPNCGDIFDDNDKQ